MAGGLPVSLLFSVFCLGFCLSAWWFLTPDFPDLDSDDASDDAGDDWEAVASGDVADADTVGVERFGLEDPFTVEWVDVENRVVRVADREHGATFRVVDRGRELAVEPNDGFDPEGSPGEWFLDAAAAIEAALPDRVDALGDADVWPSSEGLHVDSNVVDRFRCRVTDRIGRGTVVEVADDDRTATVVVDDGRGSFPSTVARASHPANWAVHAITAAEAYAKETLDHDADTGRSVHPRD